jgi:hypothetical protein
MNYKYIIIVLLFAISFIGCEEDSPGSLFDPDNPGNPAPQITAVDPPTSSLAGVGIITITGTNFSSTLHENMVYIGTKSARILEASPTQLVLQAPNEVGNGLRLRVSVAGAIAFSNEIAYSLEPAVEMHGKLAEAQTPWAIAADSDGNIYASIARGTGSDGVQKITTDGILEEYVPARIPRYDGMKFGPEGYLYLVRNLRLIARVPPGGGAEENWLPIRVGTRFVDLDFDEYGYLWAVGGNDAIFRVNVNDQSVEEFPFNADIKSVRYFDGYLYVSALKDSNGDTKSAIWRFPLDGTGNLGEAEIYFAFSDQYPGNNAIALAITFSSDGYMYVGTDGPDAIIVVHPGGNSWEALYPGLISPTGMIFAWGKGPNLYYTRGEIGNNRQALVRINTQRESAPYYGLQ